MPIDLGYNPYPRFTINTLQIPSHVSLYRNLYKRAAAIGYLQRNIGNQFHSYVFLQNFEIFCLRSFAKLQAPLPEEVKYMKGTVKWFNSFKGYGFITGEDEKDVFVHKNGIPNEVQINDGDKVEYSTQQTDRGLSAIDVKRL